MKYWKKDELFSLHKDQLMSPYWERISFEGRYVINSSTDLQKAGVDILIQSAENKSKKIDTKHIRGIYTKFYLEEMSCPRNNTPGWILKDPPLPDIIVYCFWPQCSRCREDCLSCEKRLTCRAYSLDMNRLKKWFEKNKEKYPLHTNNNTLNNTTGRKVPISELIVKPWVEEINDVFKLTTPPIEEIIFYEQAMLMQEISGGY